MINIPKGTKDVLPDASYKWQFVEETARKVAKLFNVREIRTPVFEHTELFLRGIGGDTDVVSKEMYTFLDKGDRSITLKPEGTASVARSYVENSLASASLPLKMFYITPVFRYERPQAGRLREHHQFGVEMYGSSYPIMDFEAINLAYTFLKKLGLSQLVLNLNSIGCKDCRPNYLTALKEYLQPHLPQMCPTCLARLGSNPLRILDCKVDSCKQIVAAAPKITDFICENCADHMNTLVDMLKQEGIEYIINPDIVRGLDYYTKTVFEFVTTALGSQGTVCGGGRYDNLVESIGGASTPCVGFGLGIERLIMLMDKLELPFGESDNIDIFVACQNAIYSKFCIKLVNDLRRNNVKAETDLSGKSLKAQLKYADKIGAKFVVVIGETEINSGEVTVKNMSGGETVACKINELSIFKFNEII